MLIHINLQSLEKHTIEKEKSFYKHIPIIALTAHTLKGDKENRLEAGMDGYIAKPGKIPELMGAIQQTFFMPGGGD